MDSIHSYSAYTGEMQGKVLSMAVGIFNEAGNDISETGIAGELICTRPYLLMSWVAYTQGKTIPNNLFQVLGLEEVYCAAMDLPWLT